MEDTGRYTLGEGPDVKATHMHSVMTEEKSREQTDKPPRALVGARWLDATPEAEFVGEKSTNFILILWYIEDISFSVQESCSFLSRKMGSWDADH